MKSGSMKRSSKGLYIVKNNGTIHGQVKLKKNTILINILKILQVWIGS